jgi:hypothetical protein
MAAAAVSITAPHTFYPPHSGTNVDNSIGVLEAPTSPPAFRVSLILSVFLNKLGFDLGPVILVIIT